MRRHWPCLFVAMLVLALSLAAPASAAPPANDQASGAFTIADGPYPSFGTLVPDITDATTTGDPPAPSCTFMGGPVSRGVWYRWTPSASGKYTVSTGADQGTGTTVDDTVLAVYTSAGGASGPFTEVPTSAGPPATDGCDEDSATTESLQSTLTGSFTGGTTYYIVIFKFDTPAPTAGNTAVQPVVKKLAPPQADTFADALPLALDRPVDANDTSNENDYQLAAASPCFGPGSTASTAAGPDSVYKFTAPSSDNYSFEVRLVNTGISPTQNIVVYLASVAPAPGPSPATVTCTSAFNRQSSTGGEMPTDVPLNAGQTIYIVVDRSTAASFGGTLHLEAVRTSNETEPNNTPAQAVPRSCGRQGAVNPATEADFYSLGTPATGSRIFAMLNASGAGTSADVDMRVNTTTDTVEYDDLDLDTPFGISGFAPSIAGLTATGVPLFLQVDRFGAAPAGIADPYLQYSVIQPPSTSATPETEPNDALASATSASNNYFAGALGGPAPSSDQDVYRMDVEAGERIFASLDADPTRNNTPTDTELDLIGPDGNVIVTVDGSGSSVSLDNANPPGLFETVPTFPSEAFVWQVAETGSYYVRVRPAVTGATGVGDYLLSLSLDCQVGAGPVITTASLPDGIVGTPYNQTLNADNTVGAEQFEVASGSLPAGLSLGTSGAITGTPTSTGSFTFEARVTDDRGLRYTRSFTIGVSGPSGTSGPSGPAGDDTKPKASKLKASNKKFAPVGAPKGPSKRGTTFSFELSEAATVKLSIAQRLKGRKVGKKCVKPTRKNRSRKRCTRAVKKGTLSLSGKAGKNTKKFSGKLRGRALKPGNYQATLVATDAAGNKSKAVTVRFRIVRR